MPIGNRLHKILRIILPPLLLIGCYPEGSEVLDEMDVVVTEHDVNYDLSAIHTCIMPDTVMLITEPDHPEKSVPVNNGFNPLILNEVANQLASLGYERLTNTENGLPDIYVTLSVITVPYLTNNWENWWNFWGYYPWWPGGWGPGYYPSYPWGGPVYHRYTEGTLVIHMLDVTGTDEVKIPVVWSATLNALLQGNDPDLEQRIKRDIDQAFKQSTYLKSFNR